MADGKTRPHSCRDDDPRWFGRYPHPHLAEYLAAEGAGRTFRSLAWPGWGLLYQVSLAFLIPGEENLVVEVGTNLGMSTIVLAQAMVDFDLPGRVVTYESDADFAAEARRRVARAGLAARVDVRPEAFGEDTQVGGSVAFAFVDFTKNADLNRAALSKCAAALRPAGAVLFDNSETVGVAAALADAGPDLSVVHLPHASWGFWPPPQADRGGTPGMALVQRRRR